MNRKQLIQKYLKFFESKGHKIIPNASLIPKDDPTVLFTTAGMHPLVPYLLGQKHPLGKKLTSVQKCIRTGDINEVGDDMHLTFFEMLGNWSLGDYWKKDAIEMSFEFLTSKKWLGLDKDRIAISVFSGDKDAQKDIESAKIWKSLGIKKIKFLGKKDNWWGPAGKTGPCGPCTEIFYWVGKGKPKPLTTGDNAFDWMEIWNDVFMQYNKDKRLILVDGMHCLYDENFKLNQELFDLINSFNSHYLLVVNKFKDKGYELIKNTNYNTNWEAFSLEEKQIKKDNSEYFKKLMKGFNLIPEEIIYFDHDKKNVETAKKLGILSKHYTKIKTIKKFIDDNLWAFIPLKQKNVDTGMGVERTIAVLQGKDNIYETEIFLPIIKKIEELSGKKYKGNEKAMRIITDHIKASVFIIANSVYPGNTEQGYILRRLIRRAVRYAKKLELKDSITQIAEPVFEIYDNYEELKNKKEILKIMKEEETKFEKTLEKGMSVLKKEFFNKAIGGIDPENPPKGMIIKGNKLRIKGEKVFYFYQSFGFPIELTQEIIREWGVEFDEQTIKEAQKAFQTHQKLSRTASAGKFKSGLADYSEKTTKLHTATHLLNEALRKVLNKNIKQRGSNITSERLRFDFNFPRKLTEKEIKKVEDLINKKIKEGLKVVRKEMPLKKALASGIQSEFGARYPNIVSVYSIGNFSREICTGPHVKNTKEIGKFKILKEESSAAGIRRIKAILG